MLVQFDALLYNARLWGQTVFVQDRPTAVYCDDFQRAELMQDRFRLLTQPAPLPDLVGLTEFWDESLLPVFFNSGQWENHHLTCGPFSRGFSEIFPVMREKSPALHFMISRNPDIIVKYFARSQLLEGAAAVQRPAARLFEPIDRHILGPIKEALVKMMEDRTFLGSGLVLFSRHKIIESQFVPFTCAKHGLDNYAQKGILCATIETPGGSRLSVFLSHLHVGTSEAEMAARREQISQLRSVIRQAPYPVVLMSDLNIIAEEPDPKSGRLVATDEYRWAMDQLGLYDSFRDIHPQADANDNSRGHTYDDTTHFSQALGIETNPASHHSLQRIDFILRDRRFKTAASEVLRHPMKHPKYQNRDLSDHFPLRSALTMGERNR